MTKYDEAINRLVTEHGEWITTRQLDAMLLEVWGNKHDAGMCCNSMIKNGFIDYHSDGDWQIFVDQHTRESDIEWK